MKYLDKSFSSRPASDAYRSNWNAVFGPNDDGQAPVTSEEAELTEILREIADVAGDATPAPAPDAPSTGSSGDRPGPESPAG